MKKQTGFTLMEMLVAISLIMTLSAAGLYGWRSWQQQQQLWQTARQVRDYLVVLRNDAWRHNRDHVITLKQNGKGWCLLKTGLPECQADSAFVLIPQWSNISITELTPALGFYGLRDTAWAGRIRLQSQAGEWLIIISSWGRIRMCNGKGEFACR
ncbi:prepilin peptidase-dependent protein [Leclercia adecarboxylata]|uniref:prepilin peptidase-dependent protein n=1 Tax=Leclercia adecarboxylata TaxID=83655 RepID=UPI002DBC2C26|nr:prepilin peptidase-dependent protein [Leclercia adecarboxylata]MEB6380259.1 prepilin peptidase-dependent protein [Leclercia adecarboxylata]